MSQLAQSSKLIIVHNFILTPIQIYLLLYL